MKIDDKFLKEMSQTLFVTTRKGGSHMTTVRLANGMTITGTPSQIQAHLEAIGFKGDREYYWSESKGEYLRIKDMDSTHLRNAILKMYEKWVKDLHKINSPSLVVQEIIDGNTDETFVSMIKELSRRPF